MKKIVLVVGARPNFMKIAPIDREFKKRGIETLLVHTGQHYDENMSDVFFEDLNMKTPDVHLNVGSGSHATQTAKIMIEFEKVCNEHEFSMVVVVGDVNSTIACTLVAKKLGILVTHVEAGLRSFDRAMPEEINRILTDGISDLLLTPSMDGNENLKSEGVPDERVEFVGNIMIDSLYDALGRVENTDINPASKLNLNRYSVVTLHRPSNVDNEVKVDQLVAHLIDISKKIPIIFPLHPRTRNNFKRFGKMSLLENESNIYLFEPLGYLEFVSLVGASSLVITDSGGLQEETTSLGIPCLTLRENTERPITITEGTNQLIRDLSTLQALVGEALVNTDSIERPKPKFWDGRTAQRIVDAIIECIER
jgi:UDP-N-acetylglucosamine 2-epimerase (non-hydrolysing)